MTKVRRSVYPSRPTLPALLLGMPAALACLWLAWTARLAWSGFHPLDPARWLFVLPPCILALSLASLLLVVPLRYCRGRVKLDGDGLSYRGRRISWEGLQLRPKGRGLFRQLMLSHRDQTRALAVHRLFMPGFVELEETLRLQLRRIQNQPDAALAIE